MHWVSYVHPLVLNRNLPNKQCLEWKGQNIPSFGHMHCQQQHNNPEWHHFARALHGHPDHIPLQEEGREAVAVLVSPRHPPQGVPLPYPPIRYELGRQSGHTQRGRERAVQSPGPHWGVQGTEAGQYAAQDKTPLHTLTHRGMHTDMVQSMMYAQCTSNKVIN